MHGFMRHAVMPSDLCLAFNTWSSHQWLRIQEHVRTLLHATCGLVAPYSEVGSRLERLPCPLPCPLLPEDDARCMLIAANAEICACPGTCLGMYPRQDSSECVGLVTHQASVADGHKPATLVAKEEAPSSGEKVLPQH